MTHVVSYSLALRLAWRELRTGVTGFRVFLLCICLGVTAVATVGSLSAAVKAGLARDAKQLLGGDVEITLAQESITQEQRKTLEEYGHVSEHIELRAMAVRPNDAALTEVKAVDGLYPLFGTVELTPPMPLATALSDNGVVVEQGLLDRLSARVGDTMQIGTATYVIRAVLMHEPDRTISAFSFGPHVLMTAANLEKSGVLQPGGLVRYNYRIALSPGERAEAVQDTLQKRFAAAGWRVRSFAQATDSVERFLANLSLFLTLTALTTLLCGGIGVSNAVRAYLAKKSSVIATLKTLGASQNTVFAIYFIQVTAMAGFGIAAGIALGTAVPILGIRLLEGVLPVAAEIGVYPVPLLFAALFGLLVTCAFALLHLGTAMRIPPAMLFRSHRGVAEMKPHAWIYVCAGATSIILGAAIIATSENPALTTYFVCGTSATFLLFYGCACGIRDVAKRIRPRQPHLRQAIANLYRPAAATTTSLLSMGVGLSVLVTVTLTERALYTQLIATAPKEAPTFFFLDIQPDQLMPLIQLLESSSHAGRIQSTPMLRGTITKIKGVSVTEAIIAPHAQWAVRRERGLTFAATPPKNAHIKAGTWWPPDYRGPPLISFDANLAEGMGLSLGDSITFTIAGQEVEAKIHNLRDIDYGTLQINFATIFSPSAMERFPHTYLATAYADTQEAEISIIRELAKAMPNISAIRIKETLQSAGAVFEHIARAGRIAAGVTLLAALLVLMGAMTITEKMRAYDTVILKVLGAQRKDIIMVFLIECFLLAAIAACLGMAIGIAGSYAVLSLFSFVRFVFAPEVVIMTGIVSVICMLGAALFTALRVHQAPAMPILRNE